MPDPKLGSWIFIKLRGFPLLLWHILPKISKITVTCPNSVNGNKKAQSQQNDQFENLYFSSHKEARNMEFSEYVNIFERIPLGTPPQEVVLSLAHNHVTIFFISSYRGATVIKFG